MWGLTILRFDEIDNLRKTTALEAKREYKNVASQHWCTTCYNKKKGCLMQPKSYPSGWEDVVETWEGSRGKLLEKIQDERVTSK